MKKKSKLALGWKISVLAIAIVISIIATYKTITMFSYGEVIEKNWSIDMPTEEKDYEIYSAPSFHGDGLRYHILEYSKDSDLNTLVNWIYNSDMEPIKEVNQLLNEVDISEDSFPKYEECKFYYKTDKNNEKNKIYMFLNEAENVIYIIETFS